LGIAFVSLTVFGCAAALVAARADRPGAYAFSKAAASLGFIGTALAVGALGAAWSTVALGALVLSAAGDMALSAHGKRSFLVGLACFAAAHSAYVVAFGLFGARGGILGITSLVAVLVAVGAWRALRHRLPAPMRIAVGVYVVIVMAMMAVGTAAGITHRAWMLAVGAVLVAGSDIAVGRERFGTNAFANKLVGLPTYYLGQTLIALSLVGP
jgi:uncharacterized membrane protein YhhN